MLRGGISRAYTHNFLARRFSGLNLLWLICSVYFRRFSRLNLFC